VSHEYPKALYKGGLLLVDADPDTVTVNSAEEEAKAAESGYLPFNREKSNAAVSAPAESSDEVDDQGEEQSEATEGDAPKKRGRPRRMVE
jgi:hypothetical protein